MFKNVELIAITDLNLNWEKKIEIGKKSKKKTMKKIITV